MMNGQNGTGEKLQDAAQDVAKELGELGRVSCAKERTACGKKRLSS